MEEPPIIETPSRLKRFRSFLASARFKLYCSYFLSSWGDRMWAFALSIALGVIGGDLQYPAASGLVNSVTLLFFGSIVGIWVDRTPRLKAARISLLVNNASVALSAATLVTILFYPKQLDAVWNGALSTVLIAASIILCALSVLANAGTKICITKDWVVVICGSDKDKLAGANATMVRIDMTSLVLSPLVAGQVMTSLNVGWGCAFIAVWNLGSFFVEYYMLWAVYKSCPALAVKTPKPEQVALAAEHQAEDAHERDHAEADALTVDSKGQNPVSAPPNEKSRGGRFLRFASSLKGAAVSFIGHYRTYFRQSVLPAGLAMMSLYLTVLSFDGITTVYVLSLGLAENFIALCRGIGAIMGIVGSYIYPLLRRRVGVHRTGLISLTLEWLFLLLPVASIWLPGSNFDPSAVFWGSKTAGLANCSDIGLSSEREAAQDGVIGRSPIMDIPSCNNGTSSAAGSSPNFSLIAFIAGIVLSRAGLWMADLSISQIFQETIVAHERGVVNGVQGSLNSVMTIIKSILVITLPDPRTFGILIIISWIAVFGGYCSFCYYIRRVRGHLLPFHKQFEACISKKNGMVEQSSNAPATINAPRAADDRPRPNA